MAARAFLLVDVADCAVRGQGSIASDDGATFNGIDTARAYKTSIEDISGRAMMIDMKWVNRVMALLCAANFVISSARTVLLFTAQ